MTATERESGGVDARTVGVGAALGAGAYLVGYLVVYLLTARTYRESFAGRLLELLTGEPNAWKLVGWTLYDAHFVRSTVPVPLGGRETVALVGEVSAAPAALYLLPVALLLAAGAAAAVVGAAADLRRGAVAGATVVAGYLPLAVAGAFVFAFEVGDGRAGPTLVTAVLLAGLVYPLACGAAGGGVAGLVRD
ncbi:MAG: transporter [Haloferacaceae archaeon]